MVSVSHLWQHRSGQKRLERELDHLRLAVEAVPHGLALFGENGRLRFCNRRYLATLKIAGRGIEPGASIADILDQRRLAGSGTDLSPTDYIEDVLAICAGARPASRFCELIDGRTIASEFSPLDDGGCIALHEDVTDRRTLEDKFAILAHHDGVTRLPTRARLESQLDEWLMSDAARPVAVLCVDLDDFGLVNERLGHEAGDAVLRKVATCLVSCLPLSGLLVRLGSDEFAIALPDADASAARVIAGNILRTLARGTVAGSEAVALGASIGIAVAPQHGIYGLELLRRAHLALCRAKSEGGCTFRLFTSESPVDAGTAGAVG